MASSVVAPGGDYRGNIRTGAMQFDLMVVFTEEPPIGEDYLTVVAKKDLVRLPAGVIPDGRMTDAARLTPHILEHKGQKGKTPRMSNSYIFSRIERGQCV